VRQRADRYNRLGRTKSEAGGRTVPLGDEVVKALREWKLACPRQGSRHVKRDGKLIREGGQLVHVFPNGVGKIEHHVNIIQRGLIPTMIAAGLVKTETDADGHDLRDSDGKPIIKAKYGGMHMFRHFFASWCINRKADGGLELPAKVVQERLGHATITMTLDRYGHLFPSGDDGGELARGQRRILDLADDAPDKKIGEIPVSHIRKFTSEEGELVRLSGDEADLVRASKGSD
jgi:integrase